MDKLEKMLIKASKEEIQSFLTECRINISNPLHPLATMDNRQLLSFILNNPPPVPFSKTVEAMPVYGIGGNMMVPLKHQVVNIDLQWCPSNLMRAWIDAWIDDAIINVRQ